MNGDKLHNLNNN